VIFSIRCSQGFAGAVAIIVAVIAERPRSIVPEKSHFYEQVVGVNVFFSIPGVLVFVVGCFWLIRKLFSPVFLFAL
jgi:flagellar biogenesis protein FliO